MTHWIIWPILLPALTAALLLAARCGLGLARACSGAACLALLAVAIRLLLAAADGRVLTYALGNWPAPFGIVLVLDRLAALMLVLTALLALLVLLFAIAGEDARGRHFHALYQFQLMGLNGAFLTGDFFNLFVFFEVLLIASYGLMVHGGGPARLRAGFQYVVVNLVGSSLFLIAVALIYAVTGTLNMADLARRVPQVAAADQALLQAGALLLLLVFALKAALVPVQLWLPGTYARAPAAVAALFAIMTKVGAYCIIRLYILAFGAEAGSASWLAAPWLLPAALLTLALGALGVLAARRLGQLAAFAVIGSMGLLLAAIGLFTPAGLAAALYYLLHSTLAGATLFLLADLVAACRPGAGDAFRVAPGFAQRALLGGAFFVAAIAVSGMPPLSGFIGKLLILDAARLHPAAVTLWTLILGSSLLLIAGFARAGSTLFWNSSATGSSVPAPASPKRLAHLALAALLAGPLLLTLFAAPLTAYLEATAAQVFARDGYIDAVLPPAGVGAPP